MGNAHPAYIGRMGCPKLCSCRRPPWFRDLGNNLGDMVRFRFEGDVRLRDDADDMVLTIDDRDTPDLMFPHCPLAVVYVLALAAGYGLLGDEFFNGGCFGVEAAGEHSATEVTIGDDAQQLL